MPDNLGSAVSELAAARVHLAQAETDVHTSRLHWEAANALLLDRQQSVAEQVKLLEDRVRVVAREIFYATGRKTLGYGVGIQMRTVLTYDDDEALVWALAHGMALVLDRQAFETIAKQERTRPAFVELQGVPHVTIARDWGTGRNEGQ